MSDDEILKECAPVSARRIGRKVNAITAAARAKDHGAYLCVTSHRTDQHVDSGADGDTCAVQHKQWQPKPAPGSDIMSATLAINPCAASFWSLL